MTVLNMWMIFLSVIAFNVFISGIIVGIFARSQRWSDKRIWWITFSGCGLLNIVSALVQKRMHLPYPPHMLAELGHSFIAAMSGGCLYGYSYSLALWIARRISSSRKYDVI